MGGSYRQCSECGKRALSIATRCPGCGRELPLPAGPEVSRAVELGRYVPRGVAGLIAVAAVVVAVDLGGASRPAHQMGPPTSPDAAVADSVAAASEVAYALGATAALDSASVEATPEGVFLVARTWTNVRRARSPRADLEAVLTPGDSVFVDSLTGDWYRVTFEDEVLGYVYRTTLEAPEARGD